jgi:hypothetical protein
MKMKRIVYAIIFGILLLTEIAIALFAHDDFVRPYIGDVLVTVLLCSLCRIVFPTGISALPAFIFVFAAMVEVAQYFQIVKLLGLENHTFFSTIIGTTFSPEDLVCYAVGCMLFWIVQLAVDRLCHR